MAQGDQNGRWKLPTGSFGPDVDPSMEALLRATVLPTMIVPSKSTEKFTERHTPKSQATEFKVNHHLPILIQLLLDKYPGIPRYPKSLHPSGTVPSGAGPSHQSTLLPGIKNLAVLGSEKPTRDQRPLDPLILKEYFSKYLIHLLHQIPNMSLDINSVKDCILPHGLMVIKSILNTTRKRKTLIILTQVTMYLLHLSPRNNLPGPKGDIKPAVYDDVLEWVNKILLHPDVDQSEIPLMTGCEMKHKRINQVLQSSLSVYLKDTSSNFETMKQKEMEYTHTFGAALVDEWLIGYYTEVWRKLVTVTRYEFKPENLLYKGLLKTSAQPEIDQKMPLDQMKAKLSLTIHICELIGEDSISKEFESLTNLLISMNLAPQLLQDKKILKLFVDYQEKLIETEKENSSLKIFQILSSEKIMKEFILNVENIILNGNHQSFITPWLQTSLKKYLLNQDDQMLNLNIDESKILSSSILTNFFKQISEITAQDPGLKPKFQKILGKMSF
ncbi:uncharacterized protein MELLADRAFT_66644 [Melampsora larici-populina 98AG31]|uniref:Uncharacterized protein n=1 Tax=Melampsora larici-populina (strain 98AG31 / pathotype 3-4-7) TaxID=747676 RepID=F4S029_MELLP|nr:uncharacterized protein MELLADRAFT_66644 [Melampsora larici-populina 98AG31]EGG01893.1 hypothetical protein MELLADRAFT_66644 [Melampsora larici-populina 98AG31]